MHASGEQGRAGCNTPRASVQLAIDQRTVRAVRGPSEKASPAALQHVAVAAERSRAAVRRAGIALRFRSPPCGDTACVEDEPIERGVDGCEWRSGATAQRRGRASGGERGKKSASQVPTAGTCTDQRARLLAGKVCYLAVDTGWTDCVPGFGGEGVGRGGRWAGLVDGTARGSGVHKTEVRVTLFRLSSINHEGN